jgi:hypothetical protein
MHDAERRGDGIYAERRHQDFLRHRVTPSPLLSFSASPHHRVSVSSLRFRLSETPSFATWLSLI